MRLFSALFRKKMPHGHIFRGKDRLSKIVTIRDVCKIKAEFEVEEKNMFLLRHPFLTPEQSFGHGKALGVHEKWLLKHKSAPKEYKDNITIERVLGHLRYNERWD